MSTFPQRSPQAFTTWPSASYQVDNQLLGTTQPVILCVTPSSSESGVSDSGAALQVNAVKVPSRLMLTELFKVSVTHHRCRKHQSAPPC